MNNQHKLIKGYRDLSQEEIDLMNEIKEVAERVGELVNKVSNHYIVPVEVSEVRVGTDQRWCSIAQTNLQQGFMALTRAVAKPKSF